MEVALEDNNLMEKVLPPDEQEIDVELEAKEKKYLRGEGANLESLKDKKLKTQLASREKLYGKSAKAAAKIEKWLLPASAGYLETDGLEKTWRIKQTDIAKEVDLLSSRNQYDIVLPDFGPYKLDFTASGRHMLAGGRKGHLALVDMMNMNLIKEIHVRETVRDVAFLHNDQFFAAAQKKYSYIYARDGTELHCLKERGPVARLRFLKNHFLLASVNKIGQLHYQDVTYGDMVASIRTGKGRTDVMEVNPYNGVVALGHSGGTVTMWKPTSQAPLVQMQCHPGPLSAVAFHPNGHLMATSGKERKVKIWDLRKFEEVQTIHGFHAKTLSFSQKGLLAAGTGSFVQVLGDSSGGGGYSRYMSHSMMEVALEDNNLMEKVLPPDEQEIDVELEAKEKKYLRGEGANLESLKDKKLKTQLASREKLYGKSAKAAAKIEKWLLPASAGYLETDGLEKTWRIKQTDIAKEVDLLSSKNQYDIVLPDFGPYKLDFTASGRHMLAGGRKGHLALVDMMNMNLIKEIHVRETVRDVAFLHNDQFFAAAQKKYSYIYARDGTELHCLKERGPVARLRFLKNHFLLASVNKIGQLHYQDVTYGDMVASIRTGKGRTDVMEVNPYNGVVALGHSGGTVTMWKPTSQAPLVQMQCHPGPVSSVAFHPNGHLMATSGKERKVKIWDLRKFEEVQTIHGFHAKTLSFSQKGLLAAGTGSFVQVLGDSSGGGGYSRYMSHSMVKGYQVEKVMFRPYEDVLGIGHSMGWSSVLIPGSGEPNFDSWVANPFETSKQRREKEVHLLLDKLPPETIMLDPSKIGAMRPSRRKEKPTRGEIEAEKEASVLPVYVSSGVGGVSSSSSPFSFALVTCLFSSPICEISVWRVSDDTCSLLRSSSCLSFPKVSFVVERGLSAFLSVEAWCLVSVYGLAGAQGRWWSRTVGAFSVVCGEEIHSSGCFPFARAPHGLDFTMVQPFRARRGCFLFPDSLLRLVLQRVLKSESQRFRSHRVPNLPPLQPIFVRWVWSVFVALAMAGSIHLPVGVARLGGCVGMLSHLSFHSG
ncbi:hypothetical protein F2Q70_00037544 [Brassica cretica]|uniref:BING4 C-terminal domain-containing protein n=1 Tax=Brassica cretica TaxID=69181 RepID=A0A8S9JXY4_BRACR|nr:hypothetical protein F2Q70_00037544 [Brassica cretica]